MMGKQEQVRQAVREAAREGRSFAPVPAADITRDAETNSTLILAGIVDFPTMDAATATVTAYRLLDMIANYPAPKRERLWTRAYAWVCRPEVPTEVADSFHRLATGLLARADQPDMSSISTCIEQLVNRLTAHKAADGTRRRPDCTAL